MESVEIPVGVAGGGYRVHVGTGLLGDQFPGLLSQHMASKDELIRRVALLSNEKVHGIYGGRIRSGLESARVECIAWQMPEGEDHKSLTQLERALTFLADEKFRRTDTVVSLGGGVVGDLAGLAASLYLRGIRFVQVPTTLLAMVDASVGGKTAVNLPAGKNLVGTFYHPAAVIADIEVLQTLDPRDVRAGFYELIKHGAIGGMDLLNQTSSFLSDYPLDEFKDSFGKSDFLEALKDLIAAQIRHKANVVARDPAEDPLRSDAGSRKTLNFGHTIGHALEKVTKYRYFRHGEAVGWGMLSALEIAKRLDICDEDSINLLNDVVHSVGPLPDASNIDIDLILNALESDKKQVRETLQWVLIEGIGRPRIVSGNAVTDSVVRESLSSILQA